MPPRARRMKNGLPTFQLSRLIIYKDGSRRTRRPPLHGAFSLQIMGTKHDYQDLAKIILRFSGENPYDSEHHKHFDLFISHDGSVQMDLILRKDDVGTACWRMELKGENDSNIMVGKPANRRLTKRLKGAK